MRIHSAVRFFAVILVASGLGVGLGLVLTSSRSKLSAAQDLPRPSDSVGEVKPGTPGLRDPAGRNIQAGVVVESPFILKGSMDGSAEPIPGGGVIKGSLWVQDAWGEGETHRSYIWCVRIFGPDYDSLTYEEPLFEETYPDEAFQPPWGERAEFDFEKVIFPQLPDGRYNAELSVIRLETPMTLADVRNSEELWNRSFPKITKTLTIEN